MNDSNPSQERGLTASEVAERVAAGHVNRPPTNDWWPILDILRRNVLTLFNALVVPAAYETAYAKSGVYVQDLFVAPEARRRGVATALLAAAAADARRRGLEFIWWASRSWNTDSHAFFRSLATVEEPVIAFAVFGEQFTRLADEGE